MALYAGNPTVDAHVIDVAYERLRGSGETSKDVVAAIDQAFGEELKRKVEGEILAPFGINRETLLTKGLAYFGADYFGQLIRQVEAVDLNTSFLIAGYEPDTGAPKLIAFNEPGTHTFHNNLGFCAIGTGSVQALVSLYNSYKWNLSRDDLIYRVCEAKFLSESASGVGRTTVVLTISPDGSYEGLYPNLVEPLREIWLREDRPPVPQDCYAKIKDSIHKIEWKEPGQRQKL